MNKFFLIYAFLLISSIGIAQEIAPIERVEPPNWWVGMEHKELQIMVYGDNISQLRPSIEHKGVTLKQTILTENPNYVFLDVLIEDNAQVGKMKINFSDNEQIRITHEYELKRREPNAKNREGFNTSDVLYLITPDRFANGDPNNDSVDEMKEKVNRKNKGGRHGGDIKGMIDNLDYIQKMGFTSLWVNPLLENDMEEYSYHGYSTTDFYRVDPRFGTNSMYRDLVQKAKSKGMKFIMDMIVNHCGSNHWWMNDLPASDWINEWAEYTGTNHTKTLTQDIHAAPSDIKQMFDGWFVKTMPDLNQRNPLMANYLTQNSIWWVEYLGLAGIRMDTYPYPGADYMAEWTRRVMKEYPNFQIVGEEWTGNPALVSYWQKGKVNPDGYESELTSLMDFPIQEALWKTMEKGEENNGWKSVYEMIGNDFLYADPYNLVIFPDNHDMDRFFKRANYDKKLYELGMAFICTTRGIPQFYYGSEILMSNPADNSDHGIIRTDFPGGWAGDATNGFTGYGLNADQKSTQEFMKRLLNWRKGNEVVHKGKLIHYVPQDGVYTYFRIYKGKKVMVMLNRKNERVEVDTKRFQEMIGNKRSGTNVLNGQSINISSIINLPPKTPLIVELK